MAKSDRPLTVDVPKPGTDQPIWSRVGIVGVLGFVIGIAWPKLAGVKIGPSVPSDLKPTTEASASPSGAAVAPPVASAPASAAASAKPSASADAANQELVTIGPGKVTKCSDKKDKKVDDCDKIELDALATPKLKELSKCSAALGLEGKMVAQLDVIFDKKEIQVAKAKKGSSSLPSSTVKGILQCAAKELGSAALEEVQHKHRKYSVEYEIQFYPPGKHPEVKGGGDDDTDAPAPAPASGESSASGSATVSWDTALVRKDPKDGDVVARLVRGTKVKIVSKQNDWYKVEVNGKTGWVYRGSIGL